MATEQPEELPKSILVTGGNQGIGLALCQQLLRDHGCRVFMTSRSPERGSAALASLELPEEVAARCTVVPMDVTSDESVQSAAATVKEALGSSPLYAVVNNAGTGVAHRTPRNVILDTNLFGPRRVVDAFAPLLDPQGGRIVNVGSGLGGSYVASLGETDEARKLMAGEVGWEEIAEYAKATVSSLSDFDAYGLTKACLAAWTQSLPREYPAILSSCCSPGFIKTSMTQGMGASKTPAEGTVAIRKLLFEQLGGNGWYFSSDGVRGPYHRMRNPGEPEYDGKLPF